VKPATTNSQPVQVVLLTVHLDQQTLQAIQQVIPEIPWAVACVDFEDYLCASNRPYLPQKAIDAPACIAIVDFDTDVERALQTASLLTQNFHHKIAIVALSSSADPDLLLRTMRSGCSEFLNQPLNQGELLEMIARLDGRWSSSLSQARNLGKIVSFFGAKGGVGTTILAVHFATFLVTVCRKKVLLVDNHRQLGHVFLYLGLDGNHHHFHELVRNVSRLDQELLLGFVATHPSGLDVLASPDVQGPLPGIDAQSVQVTLEFLTTQYDFVILDCEASFADTDLAVVESSNLVYLIATAEIGAIRDLSRYVDGLIQNQQATDKLRVVINRYSSREAVTIEDIEKAIHLPIAIKVANNYSELVKSINTGEPVAADRKSEFAAQIMKWAAEIAGAADITSRDSNKKRFALWK